MALFTLDQLLRKTTKDEVAASMFAFMSSVGLPVTSWQALSPLRTLVFAFAAVFAVVQNMIVDTVRAAFRDTADANWLPILSEQQYGVTAIPATFATGADCLQLDNAGGGIYHYEIGELTLKKPSTELTYHNSTVVDIGVLQTGVLVSLEADQIGAASNMAAGQSIELVTVALGVTPTLIGNITGQDAEAPDALRERDLDSLGALSPNGAAGAYEYVAKTPTLNGGVAVNRARLLPPPGDGTLTLVVAGPAGPVSVGDVAVVQEQIDELSTPAEITATVVSATGIALSYAVTVIVLLKGSPDTPTLTTLVRNEILAYVNGAAATATEDARAPIPIGGYSGLVPWRAIIGAAERVGPVIQAQLAVEADTALGDTDVATLDAGSITVSVVRISG